MHDDDGGVNIRVFYALTDDRCDDYSCDVLVCDFFCFGCRMVVVDGVQMFVFNLCMCSILLGVVK